ncbi:hypothetical protein JW906_10435 [bacterium]|nr:hypothetical protein [bacterium]
MAYTHKELKHMKMAQLQEIAGGITHEAVKGHSQMHKEQLITAICTALNIEMHEHHDVVGVDKAALKQKIRALKKEKEKAIQEKDKAGIIAFRHKIKDLKHQLRKAMV